MSLIDNLLESRFNTYNKVISGYYTRQTGIDPCKFVNSKLAVNLLLKHLKVSNDILIFADVDVDGIVSCYILYQYLCLLGYDRSKIHLHINENKKHGITDGLISASKGKPLTIIVDSSSNDVDKFSLIDGDLLVIDHHIVSHSSLTGKTLNGEYIILNSTIGEIEYKLSCGLVVYEFLSLLDKYILNQTVLEDSLLIQWALVTMYTDVIDLDTDRCQYYLERYFNPTCSINPKLYGLMGQLDTFTKTLSKNFVNFRVAPCINKYIRGNAGSEVLNILVSGGLSEFDSLPKYNSLQKSSIDKGLELAVEKDSYVYADITGLVSGNYSGVIASKLLDMYGKSAIVYTRIDNDNIKGSFRGKVNSLDYYSYINTFSNSIAEGHRCALGFTCPLVERDTIFGSLSILEEGYKVKSLVTFGENISKGVVHANSLKELVKDGSIHKLATMNSRVTNTDIRIHFYLDLNNVTYTSNAAGTLYKYTIDGLSVKGFKPPKSGEKALYVQLVNGYLSAILEE